jgi:hypothetical protein
MSRLVILVPVYKPALPAIEAFSLRHSLAQLQPGREVRFIAPASLDTREYEAAFPGRPVDRFDDASFASIPGYNRLLMSAGFYERYLAHDFMLILQTDAIVLRDELDHWCAQPYDYVGAPWPDGVQIKVQLDQFQGELAKQVKVHVGNGGFSLRRNQACIDLLREFPQGLEYFVRTGSSEDLFFSIMGSLSSRWVLPGEMAAARFSLELKPEVYHAQMGGRAPMAGHAWWKYNPGYWLAQLGPAASQALSSLRQPADAIA